MFTLMQMVLISIACGTIAAITYRITSRKEETYKKQIRLLQYLLSCKHETYDAEVIDKRENEQGGTSIKIKFKDKNNNVVTKEMTIPIPTYEIQIGDMVRIHKEE